MQMTEADRFLLDGVLSLNNGVFDPLNQAQQTAFLRDFNIKIFNDQNAEDPRFSGWSITWRYGGGLVCPPLPERDARIIIVLSCYLLLCGVDGGLVDELAYWYVRGPQERRRAWLTASKP